MSARDRFDRPRAATAMSATAMVAALCALAISLSGVAGAASKHGDKVRRGDLAPGAVTARTLAAGAVTSPKLATGAVNRRILRHGSVTAKAIGPDAVTAEAIAPGSVYGAALGARTLHLTTIKDLDQVAENGTWTAGDTGVALCGAGEVLLGAGFAMPQPGNREVAWLQVLPFLSGTGDGVSGRFASNSGGTAEGQVVALCLK